MYIVRMRSLNTCTPLRNKIADNLIQPAILYKLYIINVVQYVYVIHISRILIVNKFHHTPQRPVYSVYIKQYLKVTQKPLEQ